MPMPWPSLSGHRHQSQWQIMALEQARPLLQDEQREPASYFDDGVQLPAPAVAEEVLADYRATGLTLRAHPMSLLRDRAPFNRCKRHTDLAALGNNRFVRIAGLVTCRQRPGSASGRTVSHPGGRNRQQQYRGVAAHPAAVSPGH